MNEKKFIRSKIAIACYVLAGLLLVYTFYTIGSTIAYLAQYFQAYGTSFTANIKDSLAYLLQSAYQPLTYAVTVFMGGYILETIRRKDEANYLTAEEVKQLAAQKAAKKAEKKAKVEAKTEEISDEVADAVVNFADKVEDTVEKMEDAADQVETETPFTMEEKAE